MASFLLALEPGPRGVRARVAVTPDRSARVQDARRSWALGGTHKHEKCKPWGLVRVSVPLKVLFDIRELEVLRDGRSHREAMLGGPAPRWERVLVSWRPLSAWDTHGRKGLRECPRKPDF